ncbi:MAG: hypothetical protein AB7R89_05960 [Dehalococcoidia bacterium]
MASLATPTTSDNPLTDLEARALDAYHAAVTAQADAEARAAEELRQSILGHFTTLLRDRLAIEMTPAVTDGTPWVQLGALRLSLWMRYTGEHPHGQPTSIVAERLCACGRLFGDYRLNEAVYSSDPLIELGHWLDAIQTRRQCDVCRLKAEQR